jgi:hypothetical protein
VTSHPSQAAQPTGSEPRTAPPPIRFQRCEICDSQSIVRLPDDWQDRVDAGASLPIIGCGNPWHYDGLEAAASAAPLGLDVERLFRAIEGMGAIENGTWVSMQREDAEWIAAEYARLAEEERDG